MSNHSRRPEPSDPPCRRVLLVSAAELGGEVEEVVGNHIEIVLSFDIPGLGRAVLERLLDSRSKESA